MADRGILSAIKGGITAAVVPYLRDSRIFDIIQKEKEKGENIEPEKKAHSLYFGSSGKKDYKTYRLKDRYISLAREDLATVLDEYAK